MLIEWKQRDNDRKLVEVAILATVLFGLLASRVRRRVAYINLLFLLTVFASACLYSFRIRTDLWLLPALLFNRIFDGSDRRCHLLQFWLICICASLIFCYIVNRSSHSSTVHRKFFHLTVSLVCVTGIVYDFELIWLSAWLMLCIFAIIEIFRSKCVPPWSSYLNDWLLVFIDEQDSSALILTPIYLLAGIFLPLFLSPVRNFESPHLFHFAGVTAVGVGDSLAAIVGSRYGRFHWPESSKTVEGSIAFVAGQYASTVLICVFYFTCDMGMSKMLRILAASVLCGLLEARLPAMDNLILPLIAYFILF